ncbi:MAG: hypothetical protein PWP46_652 [Fusobacteriaceae bacterium]|jgi:hypothetical protein|nr:hypothetical protein [Fusobacteriales bacterium]MDN5303773.1 hypothetical protein [Fusobacteriaceae bacterium]
MKKIVIFTFLVFSIIIHADVVEINSIYAKLLNQYTKIGEKDNIITRLVDYKNLKDDTDYKKLINLIENFDISTLKTINEKKAFWINMYNISAIKMITDNYPIENIKINLLFLIPYGIEK